MSGALVQDPRHPLCALLWTPAISTLSLPISLLLPNCGHLLFHPTPSSAMLWPDGISPPPCLSLCQAMDPWSLTSLRPSLPSYAQLLSHPSLSMCQPMARHIVFLYTGLERQAVAIGDETSSPLRRSGVGGKQTCLAFVARTSARQTRLSADNLVEDPEEEQLGAMCQPHPSPHICSSFVLLQIGTCTQTC